MKRLIIFILVLLVLGGGGYAAYRPVAKWWHDRNRPEWRLAEVTQGDILAVVNATGQLKPTLSVQVGAFVSGPIIDLPVEFNQEVKKDELLAQIDPALYEANVDRDQAQIRIREGEIERVEALLQQAVRDQSRAEALRKRNEDFISQAEIDQITFNRMSLQAQLKIAKASLEQAQANLKNSQANLDYTRIAAPVDGIIIDRKIDPGQTLAAQFQTPELFIVAPRMREKMHVHASVDETDIGLIREAQQRQLPVVFTVDAYPEDLFEGTIEEVRFSSTSLQNVVTYPVIVGAANPDLKLLPGMTANLSFEVDERRDVIKIPNAALRFYPDKPEYVHPDDRKILEGAEEEDVGEEVADLVLSARERAAARRKRNRRHVWCVEGELLRAIEVEIGLSDSRYTELVSGELNKDQELVSGMVVK